MSASKMILKILSIGCSLLIAMLVIVGIYRGGQMAYDFGYRVFTETPVSLPEEAEDKVIQVTSGMGAMELGELLEKKGLVRDAELFLVQLKLSAYANKISEGTYTLSTSMTAREMMQVMSANEEQTTEIDE